MRRVTQTPGATVALVRPLLGWRHADLERVCAEAQVTPVADPSNADEQFERVRTRRALAEADWLNPEALSASAENLAQADAALRWAATQVWDRAVSERGDAIIFRPQGLPPEIRRRVVRRVVLKLAREGRGTDIRGPEMDRLLAALASGRNATLRGVLCTGGEEWRFAPAPPRRVG
jgi:tRNA(Ile)-lysidine synthase